MWQRHIRNALTSAQKIHGRGLLILVKPEIPTRVNLRYFAMFSIGKTNPLKVEGRLSLIFPT